MGARPIYTHTHNENEKEYGYVCNSYLLGMKYVSLPIVISCALCKSLSHFHIHLFSVSFDACVRASVCNMLNVFVPYSCTVISILHFTITSNILLSYVWFNVSFIYSICYCFVQKHIQSLAKVVSFLFLLCSTFSFCLSLFAFEYYLYLYQAIWQRA